MGYQFYNSLEQTAFVSKHVVFLDKEFLLRNSGSKVELEEVQDAKADANQLPESEADIHRDEIIVNPSKAQALRRYSKICTVPEIYRFSISEQNDVLLIEDNEPTTYAEYLNSSESNKWLIAMKSKIDSMYENQVWTLVDPPEGIKPIGCKWVFKKKKTWNVRLLPTKLGLWLKAIVKTKE